MNFEILKAELLNAQYVALTDADAAALLNTVNIATKISVSTHDVKSYLLISGKWNAIKKSVDVSAEDFIDVIESMQSVDFNLTGVEPRVVQIIDDMIIAGLLDAIDKAYILSLSTATVSRATQLGLGNVTAYYVNLARGL